MRALGERAALVEPGTIFGPELEADDRRERERDGGESDHALIIGRL
jgi:hypothetical protein